MAIVIAPNMGQVVENPQCSVCHQIISLHDATAGLYDNHGQQAFACNSHFWNNSQLILGWMHFSLAQQYNKADHGPAVH